MAIRPVHYRLRGSRRVRIVAILFAVVLTAGCYYYRPMPTPAPTPASLTYVSVALTDSGTDRLWRYLGPDVGSLRGRLVTTDDSTYTMSVFAVDLRQGTSLGWKGERVVLNRQLVSGLSERRFSVGRTTLAGGLSATAFVLTLRAFKILTGGGGSSGGGGGRPR